ncbi:hypothetical protein EAX61_08405 [Dokdonia sinensis]|uniref:Transglutaminase-like domain-containing protein n=1 Tax=Dokdonia sinensis TaxID=2479847 RepID=A0A3M0G2T3_9FLAO|nr:transglutaminase domain-containing protein [Dokdonia sinensis]RMB59075.1 hypothetical protein EAX61_08405 [Dokdonia sinensis]
MRYVFVLVFVCIGLHSQAQDTDEVDRIVSLYPKRFESAQNLATLIKRDFKNPEQQLKASYSWLIHNVEYDPKEYYNFKFQYRDLAEKNQKAATSREAMINRTLINGKAVCEGYALTLERLCELLGINSYIVRGDTKTRPQDIGRKFDKNHMWNVAIIDDEPYLIDATWGAGRYNGKFIKAPTSYYFKTPPDDFIKNHFPEVFDDAYVNEEISRVAFSNRPLLIDRSLRLDAISPNEGTIAAKVLKKGLLFELPVDDTADITYSLNGGTQWPVERLEGNRFMITEREKSTSLIIYVNAEPVIGYKIK